MILPGTFRLTASVRACYVLLLLVGVATKEEKNCTQKQMDILNDTQLVLEYCWCCKKLLRLLNSCRRGEDRTECLKFRRREIYSDSIICCYLAIFETTIILHFFSRQNQCLTPPAFADDPSRSS